MKHKTIKKSIIIIMITTILLTCVSSLAATQVITDITIYTTDYTLTPEYTYDLYPGATQNNLYAAHYSIDMVPVSMANGAGYLNGSYIWDVHYSVTIPSNCTLKDCNISTNPVINDTSFSTLNWDVNGNASQFRIFTAYSNYYVPNEGGKRTPICNVHMELVVTFPNSSVAPDITVSFSSGDAAGHINRTSYPENNQGLSGLIGSCVMQAINNSDLSLTADLLYASSLSQEGLLNNILSQLTTANLNLGDLVYYMNNVQNTRLQTIISKIQELIDMGRQDTQAQNDLNAAASQMEGAAAAMNVTKPNMNAVIPQTLADADAVAAQGTIFSWLNNSYIIAILSAMMTIALIGFVLYGKSG